MAIDLRRLVLAFSRLTGVVFVARAVAALGPWFALRSLARDEPVFQSTRDILVAGSITNFLVGLLFLVLAARLARWAAPDSTSQFEATLQDVAFVGVRLLALVFLGAGLVLAVSSLAGWYFQVSSSDINDVWFSGDRARSGAIQGSVAMAVGVGLWVISRWVAGHLVRLRRTAA